MRKYDYIDGLIYSTDNETEYNLNENKDCKKLMSLLNKLEYDLEEEKKEISRLCGVVSDCHEDIRVLSKNLDKEQKLKITYRDMCEYLFEIITEMDKG